MCSVGTEIFFEAAGTAPEANKDWAAELDQGWDRAKAVEIAGSIPELSPQARHNPPARFQELQAHAPLSSPYIRSRPAALPNPCGFILVFILLSKPKTVVCASNS